MEQYAVQIDGLYKNYKGAFTPALDGLSFKAKKGLITGLLGPNGAGKTTCISILCGLTPPDKGTAKINGLNCIKDKNIIRSVIGVVPQQIALVSHLTARENFFYLGRLYGIPDTLIKLKVEHLLKTFGLEKQADKRIDKFSGGMKRRANIIASLLHDPQLLILDEPTAGVDVQSRAMILDFLHDFKKSGKTILYTSHFLDEAQKICDEVVIIDEGRFITGGATNTLINSTENCKNLEDVFLHYTGRLIRD
jgi:ABC-2 type transport system ATP-binding protein